MRSDLIIDLSLPEIYTQHIEKSMVFNRTLFFICIVCSIFNGIVSHLFPVLYARKLKRILSYKAVLLSLGVHGILFCVPWLSRPLLIPEAALISENSAAAEPVVIEMTELPATPPTVLPKLAEPVLPAPEVSVLVAPPVAQPLPSESLLDVPPAEVSVQEQDSFPEPALPELEAEPEVVVPDVADPYSGLSSLTEDSPEYGSLVQLDDDFPHLVGAQSGCYGLENCHQLSGNFRQAAQALVAQMESQNYQLTEREDIDNTGHRVFDVIVPDEPDTTYYLNIFSPDVGRTVYVLTVDILTLNELQRLSS